MSFVTMSEILSPEMRPTPVDTVPVLVGFTAVFDVLEVFDVLMVDTGVLLPM
jgi:hypothetical protein